MKPTHMVVEVELIDEEDGTVYYEEYDEVLGYATLLGEMVIYDLDGMDIAHYSDYESVTSTEVFEDGSRG